MSLVLSSHLFLTYLKEDESKKSRRVWFLLGSCFYRPFEVERHSDGGAAGDRRVVGPDDVGVPGAEGARRLRGDHILGVFEANPEEYVAVSVSSADALRGVERVDLQLKHAGGENLQNQNSDHQAPAPQHQVETTERKQLTACAEAKTRRHVRGRCAISS